MCTDIDFSDHYPIKIELKTTQNVTTIIKSNEKYISEFDYSRANWKKFKSNLEKVKLENILKNKNIEEINTFVVDTILSAANKAIPKQKENQTKCQKIPNHLRKLIKHRRNLNKNKKILGQREELNFMNKAIRLELKEIKNKK